MSHESDEALDLGVGNEHPIWVSRDRNPEGSAPFRFPNMYRPQNRSPEVLLRQPGPQGAAPTLETFVQLGFR